MEGVMQSMQKIEIRRWKMEVRNSRRLPLQPRSPISDLRSSSVKRAQCAFTLAEMLVSIGLLALLVLFVAQLVKSAATITTLGHKRMDADSQARQLFDRMAVDFNQMLKRNDVSYWVKTATNTEPGNDQIAFFSAVPGPNSALTAAMNSQFSLVAYRVNDLSSKLERMGKGLALNGGNNTTPGGLPILFLDGATYATATTTIAGVWPAATSATADDSPYFTWELAGPHVFRFEYYYLLPNGTLSADGGCPNPPCNPAVTPWTGAASDDMIPVCYPPTGTPALKDISAIVVAIGVIDPKSRALLDPSQMTTLIGLLPDYSATMGAGQLLTTWQNALNGSSSVPRAATQNVRLYERYFYFK
jgi:hypothetical protein